jgi:hypothetical protein
VSSPRIVSGPPSVIIGVKKNEASPDSKEEDTYNQNTPKAPSSRGLETINNSSGSGRSLLGSASVGATPAVRCRDIPRTGGGRDSVSVSSADHTLDSGNKMSVAQRARLEADRKTTPIRARLDEKSLSSLKRQNSGNNLAASAAAAVGITASSPSRVKFDNDSEQHQPKVGSPQHSQSSGLWRRMEEAVLGPRFDEDTDGSYTSEGSTRITDYTNGDDQTREGAKRRFAARDRSGVEEKKSSDSVSISVSAK